MKRCGFILCSVITAGSLGWHASNYCFYSGKVQNVPRAKLPVPTPNAPLHPHPYRLDSLFPVFQILASLSLPQRLPRNFSKALSVDPTPTQPPSGAILISVLRFYKCPYTQNTYTYICMCGCIDMSTYVLSL